MQTPDFSHRHSATSVAAVKVPLLAPISFTSSSRLWRLMLAGYGLFVLSFCGALWPFLSDYPVLILVLLAMLVGVGYSLEFARRQQLAGTLAYVESGWVLQLGGQQQSLRLALKGDVLIWPGLVILPFWDIKTQRFLRLVIAADSVTAADFARLRSWLRRNLVPKT